MDDPQDLIISSRQCRWFISGVSIASMLIGCVVLFGWAYNIPALTIVESSWIAMKSNTALCFILNGIALWCCRKRPINKWAPPIVYLCSLAIMLISLLTLTEYLMHIDTGIDHLFIREIPHTATQYLFHGRMAFTTALSFGLLSLTYLLINTGKLSHSRFQIPLLITLTISFFGLLLFLYNIKISFIFDFYVWSDFYTVVLFFFTSIALLLTQPNIGVTKIALSKEYGSKLLRRILPSIILVLILISLLETQGEKYTLYESEFGDALLIAASIIFIVIMAFFHAAKTNFEEQQRKVTDELLSKQEQIFHEFADNTDEVFWQVSPTLDKVIYLSPAYEKVTGRSIANAYHNAQEFFDAIAPEDRNRVAEVFKQIQQGATKITLELKIAHLDGSIHHLYGRAFSLRDDSNTLINILGIGTDISEYKQGNQATIIQRDMLRILESSRHIKEVSRKVIKLICIVLNWDFGELWLIDPVGNILRNINTGNRPEVECDNFDKISRALTFTPGTELPGKIWEEGKTLSVTNILQNKSLIRRDVALASGFNSVFGVPIKFQDKVIGVLDFFSYRITDLNENLIKLIENIGMQLGEFVHERHTEDQIAQVATHDATTGLLNLLALKQKIDNMIAANIAQAGALLLLDVERFDLIISSMGQEAGDVLLKIIAERLKKITQTYDLVARIEPCRFVLFLAQPKSVDVIIDYIHKVLACFADPFFINGDDIFISTSLGVALYPQDSGDSQTLLKNANTALNIAKTEGSNNFQFYSLDLPEIASEKMALEIALRNALVKEEFLLFYQPQVDLKTKQIIGLEALIRWHSPTKGFIAPTDFIPLAEETDLVAPIGEWVLREVCKQIKADSFKLNNKNIKIAVNISTRQLKKQYDLLSCIKTIIDAYRIDPNVLEIEITENVMMTDTQHNLEVLKNLKDLGISISFDDFGTGFSSLSYLQNIPVDKIKIDKSFIEDLPSNPNSASIVKSIILLSHSLGKKVIAEGVETAEQLQFLMHEGCDEIQGYYFSRPLPIDEIKMLLANNVTLKIA